MNNIFENAYFGKSYKTRDGKKALYQRNFLSKYIEPSDGREHYISLHTVMTEQYIWQVDDEGKREDLRRMSSNLDIVSEWQEEINAKELEELANRATKKDNEERRYEYRDPVDIGIRKTAFKRGFEAGYRKAKEE